MDRIIGVNSNCYHGYSIEEALEGISRAGFHYVELTATKGWTEHVFPSMSFEYLNSIKSKLKETNLIPFAMSGHCNLMDTIASAILSPILSWLLFLTVNISCPQSGKPILRIKLWPQMRRLPGI